MNCAELQRTLFNKMKRDVHLLKKVSEILSGTFNLTHQYLGRAKWDELIFDFIRNDKYSGHSIFDIHLSFYRYLSRKRDNLLKDLILFEYSIIELFYLNDLPKPSLEPHFIALIPEHRLLTFTYPIYKFKTDELFQQKGTYHLYLFRNPSTFTIEMVEVSSRYFNFLKKISKSPVIHKGRSAFLNNLYQQGGLLKWT